MRTCLAQFHLQYKLVDIEEGPRRMTAGNHLRQFEMSDLQTFVICWDNDFHFESIVNESVGGHSQ